MFCGKVVCFIIIYLTSTIHCVRCSKVDEDLVDLIDLKDLSYAEWCKLQPNTLSCDNSGGSTRYYYDLKLEDCKTFRYGGCPNSYNNFGTKSLCRDMCRDAGYERVRSNLTNNVNCRLQPFFGKCHDYYPRWYYDINQRACRGFSYSGCSGNKNRYQTAQLCTAACGKMIDFEFVTNKSI